MSGKAFPLVLLFLAASSVFPAHGFAVPYLHEWGIYYLDIAKRGVALLYSSKLEIRGLTLSPSGDRFAFTLTYGADESAEEICVVGVDGSGFKRLTNNAVMDTYPAWSPDGLRIAYLSMGRTLDIWVMDADGSGARLLYDSGSHDADISWVGEMIAFTRNSQVWAMRGDGTGAARVTNPPGEGEWGRANLPLGDYDPKISPDGTQIVFERLVDNSIPNGGYDIYVVNADGSNEKNLTHTGYSQGLPVWSRDGERIAYIIAAMAGEGTYDIHVMSADGSEDRDVTSAIFPEGFIATKVDWGSDGGELYFIGEWYGWKMLDSQISCSVASSEAKQGGVVEVSGRIVPPVSGARVELTYRDPGGKRTNRTTTTDEGGTFTDHFVPDSVGTWTVTASWKGDDGHIGSIARGETFKVVSDKIGVPGLTAQVALVAIATLTVFIYAKRKKLDLYQILRNSSF